MSVNRNAVFRLRADITNFTRDMQRAEQSVRRTGQAGTQTATEVDRMGNSMNKAGMSSAAAAVHFQTFITGALNLSTAGAQVFVSMSNIDRAANRLAATQVAVARAQDLLANKEERLNQMRKSGTGSMQKMQNMEKELATARADLAVKTDKLRIEEGALTDIQILFATNVANVSISAIQTIISLRQVHIGVAAKELITEKLLLPVKNALNTSRLASIPIMKSTTTATNLQATANSALLRSLGPIGIAIAGITALWTAYEANLGGMKDALQSVFPFLRDQRELFEEVKAKTEDVNDVTEQYSNTLGFTMPTSLGKAISMLQKYRGELILVNAETQKATGLTFPVPKTAGGGLGYEEWLSSQGFRQGRGNGLLDYLGSLAFLPHIGTASAAEFTEGGLAFTTPVKDLEDKVSQLQASILFLEEFIGADQFRNEVFRQQIAEQGLKFFTPSSFLGHQIDSFADPANPEIRRKIKAQFAHLSLDQLRRRETINLFGRGGTDVASLGRFDLIKGVIINGVPIGNQLRGRVNLANQNRGTIRNLDDFIGEEDDFTKLFLRRNAFSGNSRLDTNILHLLSDPSISDARKKVIVETGFDIGNVAGSVSEDEAIRIARLEIALGSNQFDLFELRSMGVLTGGPPVNGTGFSATPSTLFDPLAGGITRSSRFRLVSGAQGYLNGLNHERNQFINDMLSVNGDAFRQKALLNDVMSLRFGGNQNPFREAFSSGQGLGGTGALSLGGSNFFGSGFFKSTGATAAFQVANVGTPIHIRNRIRIQDHRARILRRQLGFGGLGIVERGHDLLSDISFLRGDTSGLGLPGVDFLQSLLDNFGESRTAVKQFIGATNGLGIVVRNIYRRRESRISELTRDFGSILGISRGTISSIALDRKRGIRELEDRKLWTENLQSVGEPGSLI